MTVEFRCENCGKLLSAEAAPGSLMKCLYCEKKVTIPAALASLPRPHFPPDAQPAPQTRAEATEYPADKPRESDAVMSLMANIMPWVISVFFHMGLAVIMMFLAMIVIYKRVPRGVTVPDAAFIVDSGRPIINPGQRSPTPKMHKPTLTRRRYSKRESLISDTGKTKKRVTLIGAGGGAAGGGFAQLGLATGGGESSPRSSFFDSGGNAHHIVYVVDRSGSMLHEFDTIRLEMLRSISKLEPIQDFHVIFFAEQEVLESPHRRLVPAKPQHRIEAAEFIEGVEPRGSTTVLPALSRAFAVLKRADKRRRGKLIYLLTDGDFAGMGGGSRYKGLSGNEAVVAWLKDNNQSGEVHVNTYLYGWQPKSAVDVMKKIAEQHGGRYKYVSRDE
ncbi:MAG: vWA domain-containing protein [Planctomycetota bacterium]|nr:vWA domain-containing protein [Planctomycetota bacterium]